MNFEIIQFVVTPPYQPGITVYEVTASHLGLREGRKRLKSQGYKKCWIKSELEK